MIGVRRKSGLYQRIYLIVYAISLASDVLFCFNLSEINNKNSLTLIVEIQVLYPVKYLIYYDLLPPFTLHGI